VPLTLAFWLPMAALSCYEDALYTVVGILDATGLPLDQLPADPAHFCIDTLSDQEHRSCLIDIVARFAVATSAKTHPSEVFA